MEKLEDKEEKKIKLESRQYKSGNIHVQEILFNQQTCL